MTKILDFVSKNWKPIVKIAAGLLLLYWIIFILTPLMEMDAEAKKKIDLMNENILRLESKQDSLQGRINDFNEEVKKIDDKIAEIKGQKTIIKEIYHEKIGSVNNYSDKQLDSFFAARYGYYSY
jgi:hypothetical protein